MGTGMVVIGPEILVDGTALLDLVAMVDILTSEVDKLIKG